MRVSMAGLLAALVVSPALSAQDPQAKVDAAKLVGRWELKGKTEGASMVTEYTRDGRQILSGRRDGKEAQFEGTYTIEGTKVTLTLKLDGKVHTVTQTVTRLTDREMVATDHHGVERTYVRTKDE